MQHHIAKLRQDYPSRRLRQHEMDADALAEFRVWFAAALEREPFEANAMTLATADAHGRPSARIVLLKELDNRGFVFFTNYLSRKGTELEENPVAALVFYWPQQSRQVRVEGRVEKLEPAESDAYFQSRPRGARLAAWASQQSLPIGSREELDALNASTAERFPEEVPRPPHWGGYRVVPEVLEFWQGQPDRNHDRIEYRRAESGWRQRRLMP